MLEIIENKASRLCEWMNTSSNATFRLCDLKPNFMFLLRRIKELCHPELDSESHKCIEEKSNVLSFRTCFGIAMLFQRGHATLKRVQGDNVFNIPSYRANEVRCGIFKKVLRKIPQCVPLMRDDIKIGHTFKKAFAFTLAETLIVMGIIGVVAALTIPNLNSSTADKEKVAKLQKIYSNLNDAFGRAQAVYGSFDEWTQDDTTDSAKLTRIGERISEFLKVTKTCNQTTGCRPNSKQYNFYGDELSSNYNASSKYGYNVILADGTALLIENSGAASLQIHADIDGINKGANKEGTDLFTFSVVEENGVYSILPTARGFTMDEYIGEPINVDNGYGIATWVIVNGNMDYLKADNNGKCPNGKVLNWTTNTSCK